MGALFLKDPSYVSTRVLELSVLGGQTEKRIPSIICFSSRGITGSEPCGVEQDRSYSLQTENRRAKQHRGSKAENPGIHVHILPIFPFGGAVWGPLFCCCFQFLGGSRCFLVLSCFWHFIPWWRARLFMYHQSTRVSARKKVSADQRQKAWIFGREIGNTGKGQRAKGKGQANEACCCFQVRYVTKCNSKSNKIL